MIFVPVLIFGVFSFDVVCSLFVFGACYSFDCCCCCYYFRYRCLLQRKRNKKRRRKKRMKSTEGWSLISTWTWSWTFEPPLKSSRLHHPFFLSLYRIYGIEMQRHLHHLKNWRMVIILGCQCHHFRNWNFHHGSSCFGCDVCATILVNVIHIPIR